MILEERRQGRTIFFSTHILADVPVLCDHMAILQKGQTVLAGRLDELLQRELRRTDVTIDADDAEFRERCERRGYGTRLERGHLVVEVKGGEPVSALLASALERGLEVLEVTRRYDTLEELYVRSGAGTELAS